ncbi:MAG: response regulator [Deltaproteobacteria bacterium]|nr:response regulator [Deltaproteobacteria bacterium]
MKPKLLLIDDEEGIRKVLGISLRDAGYEVLIANDGEKGIALFQQEKPSIVLTDIKMPGLDGMEVLRKIKSINPETEVIMITGHGEMELAIKSLQLEASDFITKPIHDEVLFISLKRAEEKSAWKRLAKRYNEELQNKVKETTAELVQMQKELLRAERLAATGQTVAGLAHAIKNILSGLKGGRFMVNKGFELQEMKYLKDGWDMVERNIEKISGLTRDLLNFCRDREPEREPVNPNNLIREVYDLYQAQSKQQGVHLTLDLDEKIGTVDLDPRGIQEVMTNLVGNAIDACTLGEEAVENPEVCIRSCLVPENKVLLEVSDNGMGMDQEIQKKLFTIFFSTKGSRGTGLGLLLSHKIAQEHQGEIKVQSEPRKGSVFQVILPLRPSNEAT